MKTNNWKEFDKLFKNFDKLFKGFGNEDEMMKKIKEDYKERQRVILKKEIEEVENQMAIQELIFLVKYNIVLVKQLIANAKKNKEVKNK